jgi:NitT/TauT family transport system substrate-binding protein
MKDLGYVKNLPDKNIFDWSLLTEVIQENPDLYHSLKRQSA